MRLSYHAPSRAALYIPIVTLFYDGYTGTLYVRFGGCDIFTISNIAALQSL